jgi:tRNA pseudouridine55 synthase
VDGVLLVDKPAGVTSHDVVAGVRRAYGRGVKVGHAGTLDPFATGLLLILVGRGTRVQRWLMGLPKSYETVARLGFTSTTGDPEGEIVETGRVPSDPPELPTGLITQRPPIYSAIHVDGERAYARARRGEEVVIPTREVTVSRFTQDWREGDRAGFTVDCSSGTYIRSLIMDLGDAYCVELRRTAIGPFSVADAIPASRERPDDGALLSLGDALAAVMPVVLVDEEQARLAAHGRPVEVDAPDAEHVLLADEAGPIAVTEAAGSGLRKPVVGFRG